MNKDILNLITEAVNNEEAEKIEKIYRRLWIIILSQFRENIKKEVFYLNIQKTLDKNYLITYYGNNGLNEIQYQMTNVEKAEIDKMLLADGFEINNGDYSIYSITREKILAFTDETKKARTCAVPSSPIVAIDYTKIKNYPKY